MWGMLRSEFPLYALCGEEITDMFIGILDKFYQFMDFSGCSNEIRAVVTSHDGWFHSVTGSRCTAFTDRATNKATYALVMTGFLTRLDLIQIGQAWSTPTQSKQILC